MNERLEEVQVRRSTYELITWWTATVLGGFFVPGLGIVIGLAGGMTRLRAHRVLRVALPVVGAAMLVLVVVGAMWGVTDLEVSGS